MLPSLTPKRAMALAMEFSVESPAELEEALANGRPVPFPWLTSHRRSSLLKELEQARTQRGYLLIDEAESLCRTIIDQLEGEGGCVQVTATGEYRRCCPVIHALDFVAQTYDPLKAIGAFLHSSLPLRLRHRTRSRVSAVLGDTLRVTLSLTQARDFGGLLLFRTGTGGHVGALAALAQEKGLRLCSDGLRTATGKLVHGAEDEAALYARLGLPFIPPELREGGEWVERSRLRGLPDLVELRDLHGDLHLDYDGSPASETAQSAGFQELANAGLRYLTLFETPARAQKGTRERRTEFQVRIDQRIKVLRGVEVEIDLEGNLVPDPATLAPFDVLSARVLSGLHLSAEAQTKRLRTALEHPRLDILSHPHRRLRDMDVFVPFQEDTLFRCAARAGIALEVSGAPDHLDLAGDSCHRVRYFGGQVALGSRGAPRHTLRNLTWAIGQARRGLLRPEDIWNCRPPERLPLHRG